MQTYLSLDLLIDHTEDGYFVHIVNSPMGDAVAPFLSPFTPADLDRFHRLLATGETEDASGESVGALLQSWGERLFKALFPSPLSTIFQSSQRFAYAERARLRIRLQINHAPALAMLPWEYLFDPVRKEFVALSLQSPFLRYTNLMHRIVPFKVTPPLRMLVVSASPGGYPAFARDQAWLTLLDTLDYLALEHKLILERLTKPTLFDLQRRLREKEYHILHFIGHGGTNTSAGEASLLFEDEMGRGRPVNGEHLGALLRDHFSLRLVTLMASDVVRTPAANPYITIAANLIRRGVPAVVATHSSLSTTATTTFANTFYPLIAGFAPVDLAMNETRRVLVGDPHKAAWGVPLLFMRAPEGQLFEELSVDAQKGEGNSAGATGRHRLWPSFGRRR